MGRLGCHSCRAVSRSADVPSNSLHPALKGVGFHLRVRFVVPYLFYECEPGMFIVVVPRKGEVLVEGPTGGLENVAAVSVNTQVGSWFRFADVLRFRA